MLVSKARNFASFLLSRGQEAGGRWSLNLDFSTRGYNSRKLSQFINQCLQHRTYYSISFGDVGYSYEVGQTPAGDWIGVGTQSEFEYNP
ncbi:hypothetical protein NSTC745_07101 [Nostoc sp. DSM 114161]|uniref:hypothetical protein n=1 Tax=Nostoc sp. DSM 114161 TaxID=3440143 RepID=UPI004045BD16